jgi:hypothetical protein
MSLKSIYLSTILSESKKNASVNPKQTKNFDGKAINQIQAKKLSSDVTRNILFTFDYELYLGADSGTVNNCMIEPTEKIITILEKHGMKGIFFVDSTYLAQLIRVSKDSPAAYRDLTSIKNQLHRLLSAGHEIHPHIHPHWTDAEYDVAQNRWHLNDLKKYRFSSLNDEQKNIVFDEAINALLSLIKDAFPEYKMDAFRAGGWCIQPFSAFEPCFRKAGIFADFSVIGQLQISSQVKSIDFSSVAANAVPYRFSKDECKPSEKGQYIELPISSIPVSKNTRFDNLVEKIMWRMPFGKSMGDGKGVPYSNDLPVNVELQKLETLSIEHLTFNRIPYYKKYLLSNTFMQFISHPKMVSSHHLKMLDKFLNWVSCNYRINSNWRQLL